MTVTTAFKYGDPHINQATLSGFSFSFVGLSFTTVAQPIVIWAENLAGGTIGVSYSEALSVDGGTGPFTWSVLSGSLPTGLGLNTSTGVISGIPTTAASYTFTIEATDSLAITGDQTFNVIIATSGGGGGGTSNYGYVG